jgi:hypothetical protein
MPNLLSISDFYHAKFFQMFIYPMFQIAYDCYSDKLMLISENDESVPLLSSKIGKYTENATQRYFGGK